METGNHTLRVPGADIYYVVRGSGPPLLLLQGGDGDADSNPGLVDRLAERFTTLTHDRRGMSRSPIDDVAQGIRIETHGDDVSRLVGHVAHGPVLVFGTSFGALVGLELLAQHPEQVRFFIAHEPPAPHELPPLQRAAVEQMQANIEATYLREGVAPAMKMFASMVGADSAAWEKDAVRPKSTPARVGNLAFFLRYDAPAARRYVLNVEALVQSSKQVVPAAGCDSGSVWTHQVALLLARRLGGEPLMLPGGHNSPATHPSALASALIARLESVR